MYRKTYKNFLTCLAKFDDDLRSDSEKNNQQRTDSEEKYQERSWISSFNFMCLLNIPNIVSDLGPIRNYWEGGGLGEKYIQVVKRKFHKYHTNWHTVVTDKIMQVNTQQLLTSNHNNYEDNNRDKTHVRKYKDNKDLEEDFKSQKALSCIQREDSTFLIYIDQCGYKELTIMNYHSSKLGHHYFTWQIEEDIIKDNISLSIIRTCVLLPIINTHNSSYLCQNRSVYTAIGNDYTEICQDMKMGKLHLNKTHIKM